MSDAPNSIDSLLPAQMAAKAEHIGVVLNAVRAQGGGYYRRSIKTFYDYQSEE